MRDFAIRLDNRPGALAEIGESLGRAGINIEGGCGYKTNDIAIMHLLFLDPDLARKVFNEKGIEILDENDVLAIKLSEDRPGQLGRITHMMAEYKVNIEVLYLNRKDQLIMIVDDYQKGQEAIISLMKG